MAESRVVEQIELRASEQWRSEAEALGQETYSSRVAETSYLLFKRVADVVVALVGIVLCLPIWAIVAVAIKIDSRGPILFRQRRPGHHAVPFLILKFRTMNQDAEDRLDEVLAINKEEDGSLIRVDDDPRVTRVGVCGSDVHYYSRGRIGDAVMGPGHVAGHEIAGVVDALGPGVGSPPVGARVAVEPAVNCGECERCIAGFPNQCLRCRQYRRCH